ncbi:carbohydrate ABC transporter permease [Pelagibacterium halotolerans]|uniref:Sugar-binding transport system permease protein n=1 Tax=Pelagibacterium halotolerans (strain DSM 22347 / JCM 15775 / CGMCC 1.7692 / B2) TaxID=1082931 RepID=G4REM0_PELHB|nr:sugar ABC transporter permease [Pelagibacterium halotolerans]AEQ50870.1 sugar-binding transport system permease protein [Pelagibacterium halotolerans B2]QJR19220.1 sugar ABC transporter permease [Pelagibacterium halotolerans]SDZ98506.1 carbohydrate ABC transporter membrane protein 1, CUT1 family [Pelagibacterium halotolerans]
MALRRDRAHYLFLAPALVISLSIVLVPALLTFGAAFTLWDGVSAPHFTGLSNFSAIAADPVLWIAIGNNIQWTLIFLTIPMAIALVAASVLLGRSRSAAVFQVIFLLPYVLSPVANAVIWQNIIFSPVSGVVSFISRTLIPLQSPLANPDTALYAVAAVDIWHFWGYLTVIFFAAMRQTPTDQLEAAFLEGANGWQVFRFVTLPNIMPTLGLMLVLVTIFSFLTFDYVYLITQGGPARATEILSTYAYKFAFTSFQVGKAAAVALIMSFFGLLASIAYVALSRSSIER